MKRNKYIKLMMIAIKEAQTTCFSKELSSRTDGLRAIRRFERINNLTFNPENRTHLEMISGCGHHEEFFRKAKILYQ